jgi:murein DD-endopeptidase MepM/ murein hydrolase activator NlpD
MRFFNVNILLTVLLFNGILFAQSSIENLSTSINGTIINSDVNPTAMVSSENGKYWCTYDVLAATDEVRELGNLELYENNNLILILAKIPGSDIEITNSGKLVFYDHSEHFNGRLTFNIYSKDGAFMFSKEFERADQFVISSSGEMMGVQSSEGISIISLNSGNNYVIEKGIQFAIDDQNELTAVSQTGKILLYKNSSLIRTIQTGIEQPRKVIVSQENNLVGVIDKFQLKVYSLSNGNLLFEDKIGGDLSFRDLKIIEDKIVAGIHKRNKEESKGLLRIYSINGNQLDEKSGESRQLQKFEKLNLDKKSQSNYDPIPWPFFPFDSMRTVWNHYEQHMGGDPNSSYLHQGLDLITPIGEPTYSVIDGYVKCVLTLGGASYWRIAVSPVQIPGWSDGWLSAHLIQNTIQFAPGDTVHMHDYLGDIIFWSGNWGHIHFVEIRDTGTVWLYSDNEWGINFNPSLVLTPYPDVTPPDIKQVFTWSKFAFAKNQTATYLQPDSLFGEIDIIVKVVDYVGASEWQQPAYTTWYTIKRLSNGEIIKPRTLGHILNHKYPFYDGGNYQPYAGVIYQRDNTLLPSSWMDTNRNFYHNLTNSNGDSLVELSEKALAFITANYFDGDYRIIVEVYDEAGNYDIDSMDVKFKNGNTVGTENENEKVYSFQLEQNYPNPFNPTTKIKFTIPGRTEYYSVPQTVTLKVFDILGNEIATLVNEEKPAGEYEVEFNPASPKGAGSIKNPASGIYFYQLRVGDFVQTRKMVYLK